MTNLTLTVRERLLHLQALLPEAQRLADCEIAYATQHADRNPWAGRCKTRDEILDEIHNCELALKAQELNTGLERLRELDKALDAASAERQKADAAVRVAAEHEAVKRWMSAPRLAVQLGVAHSLTTDFATWYLSGKPRYAGAPSCADYFLTNPETHPGLRFTEGDREPIIRHDEARGTAHTAIVHWDALAQQRANLLREHPELGNVA
jgi:hypothetical protein